MSEGAAVVELPAATTLTELWQGFGFKLRDGGTPSKKTAPYRIVTTGVHRRLDAGIRAFWSCGFSEFDFTLEADTQRLHFECVGGRLSPRQLRIVTHVEAVSAKANLTCSETRLTVYGRFNTTDFTTFVGGPLDMVLAKRINTMLVAIGARHTDGEVALTADELGERGDLRPCPQKAWQNSKGRLVFLDSQDPCDPQYGRTQLRSEGDTSGLQARLRRIGWKVISGNQQ